MSINYNKLFKNKSKQFYCNCGNNSFTKIINIEVEKDSKTYETIEAYVCERCGHKFWESEFKDFIKGDE
jgi:uncharacterized protein with PIN domain